ncbi:hypothetical protein HI850_007895 [bacterium SPL81]|nr:hypothetical protein [Acinetobacter baumannii]
MLNDAMNMNFLVKKQAVVDLFQLQYTKMQNEISVLKIKCHEAASLMHKSQHEYLLLLENVAQLQKNLGFFIDNKTYEESFISINKKYHEYLSNKKASYELKESLHDKMNLLVIHKRKIDHLNSIIREFQLIESYKSLD